MLTISDPAARPDEVLGELCASRRRATLGMCPPTLPRRPPAYLHAADYVRIFSIAVLVLYLAYLALLAVLAGLSCRHGLTRADGYFVLLTLSTLGTVAAGVATNAFVPVVDRSGAYLGAYACANLCVGGQRREASCTRPGCGFWNEQGSLRPYCFPLPPTCPQLRRVARSGVLARGTHRRGQRRGRRGGGGDRGRVAACLSRGSREGTQVA